MVRKGRSKFVNKTYLLIMLLPLFYQTHLKSQFNLAEYILLLILITLLQSIKNSLEALATTLPIPIRLKVEEREYRDFCSFLPHRCLAAMWDMVRNILSWRNNGNVLDRWLSFKLVNQTHSD